MSDNDQSRKKRVEQLIERLGEEIAGGGCKTFEEYKSMTGRRRGLQEALDIFRPTANGRPASGDPDDDD